MTDRRIRRHRAVADDIEAIARYIARDNIDASLEFYDAVERTLLGLLKVPEKAMVRRFKDPVLESIRGWAVERFPNHFVFYRATLQGIDVIAVVHGARDLEAFLGGRSQLPQLTE